MVYSVYYQNQNVKRPVISEIPQQYTTTPIHNYKQFKEFSPEAMYAIQSYAMARVEQPFGQIQLNQLISKLEKQGKKYDIDDCGMGNIVVHIKNKFGQDEKCVHYDNGDFSKWNYCEETKYAGNKKVKQIYKDQNNKVVMYSNYYQNNQIPQHEFTKGGMTYDTTPQEYIEYLKNNKTNYKVEYSGEEDNNRSMYIKEYDNDNKLISSNWYYYGQRQFNEHPVNVSQSTYDSDEAEIKRVSLFNNKETEVTTYLEKSSRKEYFVKDIPQEIFTKEGITINTTPKEYINYLRANNIQYKVEKKEDNEGKYIKIYEYDKNGKETKFISFNTCENDKDIFYEEYKPNGNRKRIEFFKDKTYVDNFTFK